MALSPDAIEAMKSAGAISPDTAQQLAAFAPPPATHVAPPMDDNGDMAAMNAIAAKTASQDPFAKMGAVSKPMMPENSAQLTALGVQPRPIVTMPMANSAPPPRTIAAETTGFVPPSHIAAEQKKLGVVPQTPPHPAIGGGPGTGPAAPPHPLTLAEKMAKVYTPSQMTGFGLQRKQLEDEGALSESLAETSANDANRRRVLLENATDEAEDIAAENARREEQRRGVIESARDSLMQKQEELAKTEIDPDRYWNTRDTQAKVMTGIGLMMSGFRAGLQGQAGNPAAERLDAAIRQDVDAQRATFAAKSDSVKAQQSLYGQMMAEYGDERIADQATLATHWKQIGNQMEAIAAGTQNEAAKANMEAAKQFAENKVAQYTNGVEQGAESAYQQMIDNQKKAEAAAASAARNESLKVDKMYADLAFGKAKEIGGMPMKVNGVWSVVDGFTKGPNGENVPHVAWNGIKSADAAAQGVAIKQYSGLNDNGEPIYKYGDTALNSKQAEKHNEAASTMGALESLNAKAKKIHDEYGTELFNSDPSNEAGQLTRDAERLGIKLPEKFNITDVGNKWSTWTAAIEAKRTELKGQLQTHEKGSENAPLTSSGEADAGVED